MHGHPSHRAAACGLGAEERRRQNHQERRRLGYLCFRLGHAQPNRGYLRAGGEACDGGSPLALRRLPHELRPLPRRDAGTRGDGTDARHYPQVRHRPQPLARGLQGHARVRPPHGGDYPHTPPRAKGHRGARLHHRLRDWRAGGNLLNALFRYCVNSLVFECVYLGMR